VANAKVLVVDANQDSRAALAHALTEAGYEAVVATSGSFALTMLEWEQPDLIVSYAKVQDMDGYELFTMVRRDPATKDTPFLLLAGRDRPIALAATEAGVDMTVTGDFTLATVMTRVQELLGDVSVVGKTLPQLQEYFTNSVAEFVKDPRLTLALLEAQSAKIGVLGDVKTPGVMVMTRPLRVLDAITLAGGILDTGSSNVSILRQYEDGRVQVLAADMKKILNGKANPEENSYLRSGDTVIVHGNLFKTITKISSMVGVTTLVTFLTRGGR